MALLTVLHYPDPKLRKQAAPVEAIDPAIQALASDMLETMYAENGIGLAAIQVGIQKRVIVIDISEHHDTPMVLINPEVVAAAGCESMQEGCLSVPGFYETVERPEQIDYRYLTLDGEPVQDRADGLLAVCIQHEIDHLDGKLFIDYLSPLKQQLIRKKLHKQEKMQHNKLL